jgi:hypothetical protein
MFTKGHKTRKPKPEEATRVKKVQQSSVDRFQSFQSLIPKWYRLVQYLLRQRKKKHPVFGESYNDGRIWEL